MALSMRDIRRIERMSPEQQENFWRFFAGFAILKFGCVLLIIGILLAAGVSHTATACIGFLYWPLIAVGPVFMGSCCCACVGLNRLYLAFISITTLALVASTVFSSVAAGLIDNTDDKKEPVREYKLSDYRGWLRARLDEPQYWATVSACLRDRRHACKGMGHLVRDPNSGLLVPEHGPGGPIQSGCCKPPSSCAFTYVNGTTAAAAGGAEDTDCTRWSDDGQMLCFQCDSCKAVFLEEIKKGWGKYAIAIIIVLFLHLCALAAICLEGLFAEDD
ncbi:unnamed protein product [Urochloa humidicola]